MNAENAGSLRPLMTFSTASHACQRGSFVSVGDGCEDGKGVSHCSLPIYVKYVMRRSPSCETCKTGATVYRLSTQTEQSEYKQMFIFFQGKYT